jgi:hypothetical protein
MKSSSGVRENGLLGFMTPSKLTRRSWRNEGVHHISTRSLVSMCEALMSNVVVGKFA